MQLVSPDIRYKESLLSAVAEYKNDRDNLTSRNFYDTYKKAQDKEFASFITMLQEQSEGKHLPEGYVPQTTYWLVEGDEFIGGVSIRHRLTDFLLREGGHIGYNIRPSQRNKGYGKQMLGLTLPKAKMLGLTRVLITCDETNTASRKIIEAYGGVYENSVEQGKGLPPKRRYWIDLS